MDILVGILGGCGVAGGIFTIIQMCMKRKWEKEDRKEGKADKLDEVNKQLATLTAQTKTLIDEVSHLKKANKAILSDRIKWLGTKYIEAGEVEFEDRRNLHDLHDAYHNDCGGNGDYDILMRDVDALPLKHR